MAELKVEQKQSLSRAEVARLVADLAEGLKGDGAVELQLGGGTVELTVGERVRCELEVEMDGDEFELELELTWSAKRASPAPEQGSEDGAGDEATASRRVPPQGRRGPQERRPAQV